MILVLPWPDKRLTPNAKRRKHWRSYQPAIKADRAMGQWMTLEQMAPSARQSIKKGCGHIEMTITFFPPDKRRRDDDGMISAFKHMRDGIADALGVDDHRFRAAYRFEEAMAPGRVEIRFDVMSSAGFSKTLRVSSRTEDGSGVSGLSPDEQEAA